MPACMGAFRPLNPTITATDGLVCDSCNGETFNRLETIFTEDSYEGVLSQRLDLLPGKSVTLRDQRFKITKRLGFGDNFFNTMFPFLRPGAGGYEVELRNQVKVRGLASGSRVFLADRLAAMRPDSRAFRLVARDLRHIPSSNVAIFAESVTAVEDIVSVLQRLGIQYSPRSIVQYNLPSNEAVEEDYDGTIDSDIGRVLCKVAFNYFAYCALKCGRQDILYRTEFDALRRFLWLGEGRLQDHITSFREQPILFKDRESEQDTLAHFVTFREVDGQVMSQLSFFASGFVYRIVLGALPPELAVAHFGCGHAFDPFGGAIFKLGQAAPTADEVNKPVHRTFGLFNRI